MKKSECASPEMYPIEMTPEEFDEFEAYCRAFPQTEICMKCGIIAIYCHCYDKSLSE